MSEYLLRKGTYFYELAKFEDTAEPTAVYLFTKRGCSCPAGGRRGRGCKHTTILNTWKAAGEPAGYVYDDSANHIGTLYVS